MRHYCAQVSTEKSNGAVVVDLGDCESESAAHEKLSAARLCLNSEKIKVEIMEYAQVTPEAQAK